MFRKFLQNMQSKHVKHRAFKERCLSPAVKGVGGNTLTGVGNHDHPHCSLGEQGLYQRGPSTARPKTCHPENSTLPNKDFLLLVDPVALFSLEISPQILGLFSQFPPPYCGHYCHNCLGSCSLLHWPWVSSATLY